MQILALKFLFQSLIVLLDMESFIKKLNPTWLASFSFAPRPFFGIELQMVLDFLCGLLIKGLEDIWEKTWFIKQLIICIQKYKLW